MIGKASKFKIAVTLTIILSLAIVVVVPPSLSLGTISEVGTRGSPVSATDLSIVPESVVDDATRLATELCGEYQEKYNDFVNQMLGVYLEAKDKDFVMVFNPGGWGWNLLEASPDWDSISSGIQSELNTSGYTSLLLDYQRTKNTLFGRLSELMALANLYPLRAKDLAFRIEFLTDNIPDLKVILAGESTGSIICDSVMDILKENTQVYSIQTGPPFWHNNIMLNRTLVITNNGLVPDSFSNGDFLTMIRTTLKTLLGFSRQEGDSGKILHFVHAPGHEYWWQYSGVYSQITNFLAKSFGIR